MKGNEQLKAAGFREDRSFRLARTYARMSLRVVTQRSFLLIPSLRYESNVERQPLKVPRVSLSYNVFTQIKAFLALHN